jgi:hypothetical protein
MFLFDKNPTHLFKTANESLKKLSTWFLVNKLSLSLGKTYYSVFGSRSINSFNPELKINGTIIQKVDSCKYLGIFIDSKLSWQEHINYVYNKILKFTSIFYKIRSKVRNELLKILYFAFVYPHLLYGIEIYGNTYHSHIDKLVKLNNKILRILQNKPLRTHNIELYKSYDTLPLPQLHTYQILLFVHKFIHHPLQLPEALSSYFTRNNSIHNYNTREHGSLHLESIYTSYGKKVIVHKGSVLWNALPNHLKSTQSVSLFKNRLKNHIINEICQ